MLTGVWLVVPGQADAGPLAPAKCDTALHHRGLVLLREQRKVLTREGRRLDEREEYKQQYRDNVI